MLDRRLQRLLEITLLVLYVGVAIWGTPFQYDEANSGRYLTYVLQAADPELYPDDPAVDSFKRFGSLFYRGLAQVVSVGAWTPEAIEPLMFTLYGVFQALLLILVWLIAREFKEGLVLFLLLGAWFSQPQASLLGGAAPIHPSMTHATVAVVLGLAGIYALLRDSVLGFWILSGLAVFIHAVLALHLVLCVAPAWYYIRRKMARTDIVGVILFGACILAYKLWLAPPGMSHEEAQIFFSWRASQYHVSPFAQSGIAYVVAGGLLLLAWVAAIYTRERFIDRKPQETNHDSVLVGAIVSGSVFALVLGFIATLEVSSTLVQFQPMRIFTWVTVFVYFLLGVATARAIRQDEVIGALLLGIWVMDLLVASWWSRGFLLFAVLCLFFIKNSSGAILNRRAKLVRWGLTGIAMLMVAGWLVRGVFEIGLLHNPFFPVAALAVAGYAWLQLKPEASSWKIVGVGLIVLFAVLGGTTRWQRYYNDQAYPSWGSVFKDRVDHDWRQVQNWCAQHTNINDRFIIVGGQANFRVRAQRTGEGESMVALVWVDPLLYQEYEERRRQIMEAAGDVPWNLDKLASLASSWDFQYVIVRGAVRSENDAVFSAGPYQVFSVPILLQEADS